MAGSDRQSSADSRARFKADGVRIRVDGYAGARGGHRSGKNEEAEPYARLDDAYL